MIVIIDYGMGNSSSIRNMLKKVGYPSVISSKLEDIKKATQFILPGVGSFDAGMRHLHNSGLIEILTAKVMGEKVPILGICLGMQLMGNSSAEGSAEGLGWINADAHHFTFCDKAMHLKVPHMGWNKTIPVKKASFLVEIPDELRFYFVHSYYMRCENNEDVLFSAEHGNRFHAAYLHENICGLQFHPEKSHKFGMWFFRNYMKSIKQC